MHIDPVIALKAAMPALKKCLSVARRQFGKHKADQMTSWLIAELLKQSPDMTAVKAQLAAIEATGVEPTLELHRAKNMFAAVRAYQPSPPKTAKTRWAAARRGATQKTGKRKPRRGKRKRVTRR